MDDLKTLIDQYETAKDAQGEAYKKMQEAEPQLYKLWEEIQAIRKDVTEKVEQGILPNMDALRIAAYGPEIVQNAFMSNERPWLDASLQGAKKLEVIIKKLYPDSTRISEP